MVTQLAAFANKCRWHIAPREFNEGSLSCMMFILLELHTYRIFFEQLHYSALSESKSNVCEEKEKKKLDLEGKLDC